MTGGGPGRTAAPAPPAGSGRWSGRRWSLRSLALLDQVVSGLSNVLAVVLVARSGSPADFGRFSLAYAVLTVTLTMSRALLGTRLSLTGDRTAAGELTSRLVGDVLVVGPLVAAGVLGLALAMTGGRALGLLLLVACAAPLVCAQDLLRFGAVSAGRPGRALLSDAVWLAVIAVPLLARASLSAHVALAVWLGGAVAALGVGVVAAGRAPRPSRALRVLRSRSGVGESVLIGTAATAVASVALLLVVGRLLGPGAAGGLRGAAAAMGPVNVLLAFVSLALAPALVRRARADDLRFCLSAAGALLACSLAWGVVLLALPARWGSVAFGSSWPGIRHVLPFTVCEYAGLCVAAAGTLGLKVRGAVRQLVTQRLVSSAVAVSVGTGLAVASRDVRAVAAVLALSAAVLAALAWLQLVQTRGRTT